MASLLSLASRRLASQSRLLIGVVHKRGMADMPLTFASPYEVPFCFFFSGSEFISLCYV